MATSIIGTIALAAGGTGGHLFPAEALASKLSSRGFGTVLLTDNRAKKFGENSNYQSIHVVSSGTFHNANLIRVISTGLKLVWGIWQSIRVLLRVSPKVVVGFGGFPSVPPLIAARFLKIPTIIHEANTKMGRANRFLAKSATAVALSISGTNSNSDVKTKVTKTGNPVRPAVLEEYNTPYPKRTVTDQFRLLVFGGSQGARFFSETVPQAIAQLTAEDQSRLEIVQQCREEDIEQVEKSYDKLGVSAEVKTFFSDLPKQIAQAHLVVCRAGASTISELAVIGRPSVLVPLPNSIEKDQYENAKTMHEHHAAHMLPQNLASVETLKDIIEDSIKDPQKISKVAQNAKKLGNINATEALANLIEASIPTLNSNNIERAQTI